ncbi:MAG TPA: hypothetical protein VF463_08435 [Sphingobium sp.]
MPDGCRVQHLAEYVERAALVPRGIGSFPHFLGQPSLVASGVHCRRCCTIGGLGNTGLSGSFRNGRLRQIACAFGGDPLSGGKLRHSRRCGARRLRRFFLGAFDRSSRLRQIARRFGGTLFRACQRANGIGRRASALGRVGLRGTGGARRLRKEGGRSRCQLGRGREAVHLGSG